MIMGKHVKITMAQRVVRTVAWTAASVICLSTGYAMADASTRDGGRPAKIIFSATHTAEDDHDSRGPSHLAQLAACVEEDGSGQPGGLPCRWDAANEGNGIGDSFVVIDCGPLPKPDENGATERVAYLYDDGHTEFGTI
jgi:hypothetical protein